MINRIINWIKSFWQKPKVTPRKKPRQTKDHTGAHYYLGDLLDCLDASFDALKAVKKVDRDAYDYLSRVGAPVLNSDGIIDAEIPPHIDCTNPPTVIAWACPKDADDDEKHASCRMFYAIKEHRPVNVQLSNLPVYRMVLAYAPKWLKSKFVATGGYIELCPDGSVKPLRQLEPMHQYHRGQKIVTRMTWTNPWEKIARHCGEGNQEKFLTDAFRSALSANEGAESGLTIRASDGARTARFSINMLRTPYFFADRDRVVNENGKTKRIFHIVRGHWREGTGGNKKWIKSHFRGLRKFTWNGYRVSISLSGLHYNSLSNFAAETYDERDPNLRDKTLTAEEVGKRVAKHMEGV